MAAARVAAACPKLANLVAWTEKADQERES